MSGGTRCNCPESKKPISERAWRVTQRYCNHSALNGYHRTLSAYSTVVCRPCSALWRTKASYVAALKDD